MSEAACIPKQILRVKYNSNWDDHYHLCSYPVHCDTASRPDHCCYTNVAITVDVALTTYLQCMVWSIAQYYPLLEMQVFIYNQINYPIPTTSFEIHYCEELYGYPFSPIKIYFTENVHVLLSTRLVCVLVWSLLASYILVFPLMGLKLTLSPSQHFHPNFWLLGLKLLIAVTAAILSRYMTVTTPTN